MYQSNGIEKDDDSRQSLENHGKIDEIRRLTNKKFAESHDAHLNLALAEVYLRPTKRGEYQYMSDVMGKLYNLFLDSQAGAARLNFGVTELLKFWTERIIEIDGTDRRKPSLGLMLDKVPEVICVPRSEKKVELRLQGEDNIPSTSLGTVWKMLRPFWFQQPQANLNEEVTERVRLSPGRDEDLGNLNVIHKLILPLREKSKEITKKSNETSNEMEPGTCLELGAGGGEHSCDERSCVRIQSFQRKDLATWFGDITEREKSEVQIIADCYASTTMN